MTSEAGERVASRRADGRGVSGSVVATLLDLVRARTGDGGVAQVLALAEERRDFARLTDPRRWSSLAQAVAIFDAAALVTGQGAIALHVGQRLLLDPGTGLGVELDAPGDPAEAVARIHSVHARFDETASAAPVELAAGHALVRVSPRPGTGRHAHLCELARGLLTALPTALGRPPAMVTESECAARGGRHCLYELRWEEMVVTEDGASAPADDGNHRRDRRPARLPTGDRPERDWSGDDPATPPTRGAARDTRSLLSFSERLSRLEDLSEAVQLVVDVVPELTGCDQSALYLWDNQVGHLVPRARTSGPDHDDTGTGVVAVTGGPVRPAAPAPGPGPGAGATPPRPAGGARAGPDGGGGQVPGQAVAVPDQEVVTVPTNAYLRDRLVNRREVIVVDRGVHDPALRRLLADHGTEAAVIAPLFTAGALLGTLSASYRLGTPPTVYRDPAVHDLLAGVADQAAATLRNLDLLAKISHMAWHDALTGLPNRRLFEDRVGQELIRSQRVGEAVCLFFVDLDHFKTVNDTFGHGVGDELIQQVSDRLVDTVRGQDTVARVGGDEFAVLLPGLSDQLDIDQLAARMLESVAQPFDISGEAVHTTASIGAAVAPEHGERYDELLSRADEAMYRAKAKGRNAFETYSPAPTDAAGAAVVDERALYRDLVHALGSEQFFLVYQPYVDLRTTEVLGVEALLRWRHPKHGLLEPPTFLPLAERSDAIVALDTWVLEEACRQLRRWRESGLPPVSLAVNLSSRDLENPDYAGTIERILGEHDVDPGRLELDVTERVVIGDERTAQSNIDRLRRHGVRFTVDDFGRANSSLTRIGAFPVNTLKIDRSFVQVLSPGGDADHLVSAIVDMADRLGLECVAEGVETPLQSRVLLQRGCTTAQGYFLCPPLSPYELESALTVVGSPEGTVQAGHEGTGAGPGTADDRAR